MFEVKQEELVTLLRNLADSVEQKDILEDSVYINLINGVKQGPPIDEWATWELTGERSVRIYYTYKEVLNQKDEESQ